MTLYLKLNKHMTGKLGTLERLLPWRRKVGGVDPGMKNESVRGKKVGGEEYWCWPSATPTKAEKKQIIGRVCEIAVRTLFTNFVYTFGGQSYLQLIGGPIGARVTMAVARIVMQKWGENFRVFLQNSGMPTPC